MWRWLLGFGVLLMVATRRASSSAGRRVTTQLRGATVELELFPVGQGYELAPPAADAAVAMISAAGAQGIVLHINSAWRSNEQQGQLREEYLAGKRALAAPVGYSNHEAGRALDIETGNATNAAFAWLNGNASRFRFRRTVPSEPWHWEFV